MMIVSVDAFCKLLGPDLELSGKLGNGGIVDEIADVDFVAVHGDQVKVSVVMDRAKKEGVLHNQKLF